MNFDPSLPTSYEYIHYTGKNMDTLDLNRTYTQTAQNLALHRPNGLWLSIAGINDWEKHCLESNYNIHNLKYEFQVKLKPYANILILYNNAVFEDFEKKYAYCPEGIETDSEDYTLTLSIRWQEIIKDFQGLALPNVLPKLYDNHLWYDIWHCASACIWDLQAVDKIDKLGTM
jgi:hypothetical protein